MLAFGPVDSAVQAQHFSPRGPVPLFPYALEYVHRWFIYNLNTRKIWQLSYLLWECAVRPLHNFLKCLRTDGFAHVKVSAGYHCSRARSLGKKSPFTLTTPINRVISN